MLDIVKDTRFVISPSKPFGGPAYEAASYGSPMIVQDEQKQCRTTNGGDLFEGVIKPPKIAHQQFVSVLTELQTYHVLYRKHENAYRAYVRDKAANAAFVEQIDNFIKERGWEVG